MIKNNGKIELSYREIKKKYNIANTTFSRAIQALEEFGFITIDKVPGKHGLKNLFTSVDRWKAYGTDDYKPPLERDRTPINGGFKQGNKHGRKYTAKQEQPP